MNEKLFESLPEEKRKKIIDACIEEFALNGYEKGSTNSIVKKADISKGLLFYYFGNKKNLFLYIFDYSVEYLLNKYYAVKCDEPSDLFERLVWLSMLKMRMTYEEPLMSKMLFTAIVNMPKALEKDLTERYNTLYAKNMPVILKDVDTSKFRKGIEPQKAIELIMLCLDGLSNKYINMYKNRSADEIFNDMEKLVDEFNKYIEIIKYGVYEMHGDG